MRRRRRKSACDQELQDAMLLVAALVLVLFAKEVLRPVSTTAFTQQVREKQAPHAAATQHAAPDQDSLKFLLLHNTHNTLSIRSS